MFPLTDFFLTDHLTLPFIILAPETTVAEAIAQMEQQGTTFVLAVSPATPTDDHNPTIHPPNISIFTEKELVQLLAHPIDWQQQTIAAVMVPACTMSLAEVQHPSQLLAAFQRTKSRYLVILDATQTILGVLNAEQLLSFQSFISQLNSPVSSLTNLVPQTYQLLFESLPIGLAITDEQGHFLAVNHAFQKIWSSDPSQANLQIIRQQQGAVKTEFETEFEIAISPQPSSFLSKAEDNFADPETSLKLTSAQPLKTWLKVAITPLSNTGSCLDSLVISYVDITRLKQSELDLEHSLSLLKATVESTADGIVSVTLTGEVVSFNQRFLEMWQIPEALIRAEFDHLWFEHILDQLLEPENFAQRVQSLYEKPTIKSNDILKLKNGKVFERRSLPYKLGEKIIGRVWSFRDITQTVQLEQTLRLTVQRERLMTRLQARIRQSLELKHIIKTAVWEVQKILQSERVAVYQIEGRRAPKFIVEAVQDPKLSIVGLSFTNPQAIQNFWQTIAPLDIVAVEDLENSDFPTYEQDLIQEFTVRAYLCVPLIVDQKIWGLLYVQECSRPRHWQEFEQELLRQLSRELAIAIQQSQLYQKLQAANEELQRIASLDSLTQIANRLKFDEYLAAKWRYEPKQPLSLILCDIDCFKIYNDTYGHQAGDNCLRQVAGAIRLALPRSGDLVARYGGEEFAVILPETSSEMAIYIAHNIQGLVKDLEILHIASTVSPYITISLGVATLIPETASSPAELIAAADRALYQAKQQGRDRVILYPISGSIQDINLESSNLSH